MTPLPLSPARPLTPAEFEGVYLQLLAAGTGAGHAGRPFINLLTEDEIEKVLGHEITARLRATTRLFKIAATNKGETQ